MAQAEFSTIMASSSIAVRQQNVAPPNLSSFIRKVVKEDYRGATPAGLISLVLVLPSAQSDLYIKLNDVVMRKALDEVRDRCQVWIDCFENDEFLVISARKDQHIRNGVREVREWIMAQSKELKANATTLVHRMNTDPRFCICLKPTQELGLGRDNTDGWRGVAQFDGVKEEESHRTVPDRGLEAIRQSGQKYSELTVTKQLLDAIHQAARLMRPDLGQKYVRVHLGIRALSKRKTKDKSRNTYSTPQFRDLMSDATTHGHVSFRLRFGNHSLPSRILQHAYQTDNPEEPALRRLVPVDATIERLMDVKPRFCLVFFSGNLRIEIDIHMETAKVASSTKSRGANRSNLPTASSPRIFRFNKTVDAEIAVACPDMKVDWQLAVDSDLSADKVHDKFRDLAKDLRFGPVSDNGQTFPIARASRASLRNANINSVACKAIWTFECVKAPFRVDLTEYYDWDAYPLSEHIENNPQMTHYDFSVTGCKCPIPNKSCAVSLYGDDWDEKLRDLSPASGRFAEQLLDLFGHGTQGEQYVDSLLHEIGFLLEVTSQAVTEAEVPDGPP